MRERDDEIVLPDLDFDDERVGLADLRLVCILAQLGIAREAAGRLPGRKTQRVIGPHAIFPQIGRSRAIHKQHHQQER